MVRNLSLLLLPTDLYGLNAYTCFPSYTLYGVDVLGVSVLPICITKWARLLNLNDESLGLSHIIELKGWY